MGSLLRVTAVWSGFTGGPGYSNFYWESAVLGIPSGQIAVDKVATFFSSIKSNLPSGVRVDVNPVVAEMNDVTGQQVNEYTVGTPPLYASATGVANRAGGIGACITWRTASFVAGKRLRGRTFIVPLTTGSYDVDGTLVAGAVTSLQTAAATLINNSIGPSVLMKVWHRPSGGGGGSSAVATSASVTDKVAVLTSRR